MRTKMNSQQIIEYLNLSNFKNEYRIVFNFILKPWSDISDLNYFWMIGDEEIVISKYSGRILKKDQYSAIFDYEKKVIFIVTNKYMRVW